jgi:hypothetical protein
MGGVAESYERLAAAAARYSARHGNTL